MNFFLYFRTLENRSRYVLSDNDTNPRSLCRFRGEKTEGIVTYRESCFRDSAGYAVLSGRGDRVRRAGAGEFFSIGPAGPHPGIIRDSRQCRFCCRAVQDIVPEQEGKEQVMKGTVLTVSVFLLGCAAGWSGLADMEIFGAAGDDVTIYLLYLLMFLVGISVGANPNLKKILGSVSPKILLLPVTTVLGTLAFSALASLLVSGRGLADSLAIGSGMGYYSLSSVLIGQLKEASAGAQLAAELGTIALLTNIFREMFTLVGAPLLCRWFGPFAPIASAGATAFDVCLPVIVRYSGDAMLPYAIVSGVVCDMSVPFLVSFFCSF